MRKLFYKKKDGVVYLNWFSRSLIIILCTMVFTGSVVFIGELVLWLTS